MDTNSSLRQRLILALTSVAGDLVSASAEWACCAFCPKPNPSLCFQTSVLTLLAHKPSRLGIPEPQRSTLPAHQKKNFALCGCPETQNEYRPARHSTTHLLPSLPWAIMLCLTQPEPRPPDRYPDSWPHTQHFRPAMVLGRHLFPTWIFGHQNLDRISNPCTGGNLMPKSELLHPHGKKPCCWHGVKPSG